MLNRIKSWLAHKAEARKIERETQRILDQLERNRQYWQLIKHRQDSETEEVLVDYMDTRGVSQRPVVPRFVRAVRPFGIGRWRL